MSHIFGTPYRFSCDYCKVGFIEDSEVKATGWGMFHEDCKTQGEQQAKDEYQKSEEEYYQEQLRQQERDQKLLRKLRKRLPTKIMKQVELEVSYHGGQEGYKIVTQDQCKGDRMKGKDYFGDGRCPIRTVYDDVSSGGYPCDDCYSGDIYIYIGKGQYFNMWVNG